MTSEAQGAFASAATRRDWRPHTAPVVVAVVGLVITALLVLASHANYVHNERHLTVLQTKLTADALAAAPDSVERQLGHAADAAAISGGNAALFRRAIAPSTGKAGPFATAELLHLAGAAVTLDASVGAAPALRPASAQLVSLCERAERSTSLTVTYLPQPAPPRLGYAVAAASPGRSYVAYAEERLPASRRITVPAGNPDADLFVAIYFGRGESGTDLLLTNSDRLPLHGTTATTTVPFGDSVLTLVAAPRQSLAGTFAHFLAMGIGIVGVLVTLAAVALSERLVRRRLAAEALAEDNRRLYDAQRNVSRTLQHSLLPQILPRRPDLQVAARYRTGTAGIEVGGDWYDVVDVDDHTVFFTVGDIAGRGLDAAILMSSLRNAVDAHATDGDPPEMVLAKLGRLVDVARDGRFATVICGRVDVTTGQVTIANAGHPEPLIVHGGHAELVHTSLGPPVGVGHDYTAVHATLPRGSTLLAYTDGLVERRGESLGAGLQRLRDAAAHDLPLEALLDKILITLVPGDPTDDVAALGIRWSG